MLSGGDRLWFVMMGIFFSFSSAPKISTLKLLDEMLRHVGRLTPAAFPSSTLMILSLIKERF